MRVLQVLGSLDRGGIETWLMQVMSRGVAQGIQMDFAVYEKREYAFSPTIQNLGGMIFAVGRPDNPLRYISNLRRILRTNGPYDVVHSQMNETSGLVLLAARLEGIEARVAHSHIERLADTRRKLLYKAFRQLCKFTSRVQLACSSPAGQTVFAAGSDWEILHCGVDIKAIEAQLHTPPGDIEELRAGSSLVVGHVGRFDTQKNHLFLIDVFVEIRARVADARLLLVGKGVLEKVVREKVHNLGLQANVVFLGVRDDVPALMAHVFDVFVFPSLMEGLGNVLIEAQAVGLPCVVSSSIPGEAMIVDEVFETLSVDQSVDEWANHTIKLAETVDGSPKQRVARINELKGTSFDVDQSARKLFEIYADLGETCTTPVEANG